MGRVGINMTVRYSHLVPEHKAQAVAKLGERFNALESEPEAQSGVVSEELKQAIGEVLTPNLERSRNVFLVRKGRGLKIVSDLEGLDMARDRIELPTRGFSVAQNKKPAAPKPQNPNKPKGIIPPITSQSLGGR